MPLPESRASSALAEPESRPCQDRQTDPEPAASSGYGRYVANVASLGAVSVGGRAIGFTVNVYLARALGPALYGLVNTAMVVVDYFALLLNKGIEPFGTREVARDPGQVRKHAGNLLALRTGFLLISMAVLGAAVWLIPNAWNRDQRILISLYGLQLIPVAYTLDWIFQGIQRMQPIAYGQLIGQLTYLGGVLWLVRGPAGLHAVPLLYALGLAVDFLVMVGFLRNARPEWSLDLKYCARAIRETWPMAASTAMTLVYQAMGVIVLAWCWSSGPVGYYRAVTKLQPAVSMIPTVLAQALFPNLAKLSKPGQSRIDSHLVDGYQRIMIGLAFPAGVILFAMADTLVVMLYKAAYAPAIPLLRAYACAMTVALLSFTYGNPLLAWNLQKQHLRTVFVGAAANVALCLALIPRYGAMGATIGTCTAESIVFIGFYRTFSRATGGSNLSYFTKPAVAAALMGIVIWAVQHSTAAGPFVAASLGAIAYIAALWLSRYVTIPAVRSWARAL